MSMIRRLLAIILFAGLLISLAACEQKFTPPVGWPNESPPVSNIPGVQQGWPSLPLVREPTNQTIPAAQEYPPKITATPYTIYTYTAGAEESEIVSTIKVNAGVFDAGVSIDIWGSEVTDAELATNPPLLMVNDLDAEKEYIQGKTGTDGGVEFKIRSDTSPGTFKIYVSDGTETISTVLTIKETE